MIIGCNLNKEISHFSDNFLDMKNNNSYSANYLTANYSISKGDAYTASHILDKNLESPKLLEIKFISNLASGKFDTANRVSNKIKVSNNLYELPKYILQIKNGYINESLNVFTNKQTFFNSNNLNDLIEFWIYQTENKNIHISQKYFQNTSIHKLLILENFYNSKKLIKIADLIYKEDNLNSYDTLLLAGFYYRVKKMDLR